jgi:hypothetical protein
MVSRALTWIAAGLGAFLGCAAALAAQKSDTAHGVALPAYRARVLGIYDEASGEPVKGVRVLDISTGMSALTSVSGAVALFFLPDGGSLVRLQKIGYAVQTLPVAISPRDTAPITIIMRRVVELSPVVTKAALASTYISPHLRGFEERRRRGFGTFIDDSVLRANENHPLANVLLSRGPGIIIRQGAASATFLMPSPRCVGSSGGPPQVFLDGVLLSPDIPPSAGVSRTPKGIPQLPPIGSMPFDLSKFDVSNLAGVEWYPDNVSAPVEFSNGGRCGTLLLWTRER